MSIRFYPFFLVAIVLGTLAVNHIFPPSSGTLTLVGDLIRVFILLVVYACVLVPYWFFFERKKRR